jgi:hypothetical protein
VASVNSTSNATLARMVPPSIQEGAAKSTIWPAVFAAVTFLTNWKQQAVAKCNKEVLVRHGAHTSYGRQQERAGPRAPVRARVSCIGFAQSIKQLLAGFGAYLL